MHNTHYLLKSIVTGTTIGLVLTMAICFATLCLHASSIRTSDRNISQTLQAGPFTLGKIVKTVEDHGGTITMHSASGLTWLAATCIGVGIIVTLPYKRPGQ